jgi:hypothetical protein
MCILGPDQGRLLYYLNWEFQGVHLAPATAMAYVSVEADDVRNPSFYCQFVLKLVIVASRGRAREARVQMCVGTPASIP